MPELNGIAMGQAVAYGEAAGILSMVQISADLRAAQAKVAAGELVDG